MRVWLLLPLLILLVLGGYCAFSAMGVETTGVVDYRVNGEIDYRVYLKDNDYYTEKFLGKDMQYIASLINVVRTDFGYELEADDDTQATYEYEIIANAKATDRSDKSRVLYEKSETLKAVGRKM